MVGYRHAFYQDVYWRLHTPLNIKNNCLLLRDTNSVFMFYGLYAVDCVLVTVCRLSLFLSFILPHSAIFMRINVVITLNNSGHSVRPSVCHTGERCQNIIKLTPMMLTKT